MVDEHDAGRLSARADETGQVLMRSGIEIGKTLEAMCAAGDALSADLGSGDHLFVAGLLEVDARNGTMTVGWSGSKEANTQVMHVPSVTFNANHEGLHFQFVATHPRQTDFGNQSAIQLDLPTVMLAVQRRVLPRYKVPPSVPLRCEISLGPIAFDALVVDLSADGIGAIIYDLSIRLEVGMTLSRARIELPGHAPVLAALEVRNIRTVTHASGTMVKRAGCRFIAPASGIEALLRLFLAAIEPAPK